MNSFGAAGMINAAMGGFNVPYFPHHLLSIDRSWDYFRIHCMNASQKWRRKRNRRIRSNNR